MIWFIGSSLISKAYQHVKSRPLGDNLGLQHYGYNVIWVGHPGLKFTQVSNLCHSLINANPRSPPAYLIIHAGGNDIGWIEGGVLRQYIKDTIYYLQALLPYTCIIWSCILPRIKWRYSSNTKAMEKIRTRINREIIRAIVMNGGKAIKHPDFDDKSPGLFEDSCHLSFIGRDLFQNTFQVALDTFINYPDVKVYPSDT